MRPLNRSRRFALPPSAAAGPLAFLAAAIIALAACDRRETANQTPGSAELGAPVVQLSSVPSPAPPGSAEPNIAVGPDGFYLSWIERLANGRHALRFATLAQRAESEGGNDTTAVWSAPRTIVEGDDLFVNWADFPSLLALDDGTLAAHWLQKSGPGTYAYDVRTAISTDGGQTWAPDVTPHRDGEEAEHGFVSLIPAAGAEARGDSARRPVGAVWLDGRETVHGQPMTLRYTTLGASGADPEILLDPSVCDCCQTAAAMTAQGPVVLYRDRTEDEIRDIHVVRQVDGEWTEPTPVHRDGWEIDACPVNGPSIDAAGDRVVAAWFTGAEPEGARVLLAFSDDAGATFGEPIRLDQGGALGRVDVLLLPDGSALASWVARGGDGAGILLRRVAPTGAGPAARLRETSPERASGFPRIARAGDRVLFAWTDAGETPRVRTALGRIEEGTRK